MTRTLLVREFLAAALVAAAAAMAAPVSEQDIQRSFYPYNDWKPEASGITPGLVLNQGNWELAKDVTDEAMLQALKDGWVEITVGATNSFELHPNYVEATRKNAAQVALGPELGKIDGYVAGRAFPQEPDPNDPRAGEKLAWNYQYGYNWGDNAVIGPFYWHFRDMNTGKTERTIKFKFAFLNLMHRVNQPPVPQYEDNPAQIFRSIYLIAEEPFDVKNTQLLIYRYQDDLKRDDSWLYLGFQRRVRRLATGQITDSFLGTDLMIQDFEGYNGRISDMQWKYLGTVNVLMPFYYHDELELDPNLQDADGYRYVDFHGKGSCFPKITWQLRKAYRVEVVPVDTSSPIGKRIVYMDAQTFALSRSLIYDKAGKLWKTFIIGKAHQDHHLPQNKGTGVPLDDSAVVIDMQALHCTALQFRGMPYVVTDRDTFTVQNMRVKGR